MHRVLWCECGQKMRITPEMLGAAGKCVKCGREVIATEMNTTLVGDEGDQMAQGSRMPPPPPPPAPPRPDYVPPAGMAPPPAPPARKASGLSMKVIGIVAAVVVLGIAGYLLLGRKGDPLAPNDKNFARALSTILEKEPECYQEQFTDKVRDELVNMGILLAVKKGYSVSYEIGDDKDGILVAAETDRSPFTGERPIALKCAVSDSNVKVVRFTLPPKGESAVAYEVIYSFQWKPTALLTDAKYKAVQDAMGPRVDKIRDELKKSNNRSMILVRYNDGWHKAEHQE